MILISQIKSDVSKQLIVQIASFKILFTLRIDAKNADFVMINLMIKSRDIYNLKAQLRREELDSLSLIQALIREFDQED